MFATQRIVVRVRWVVHHADRKGNSCVVISIGPAARAQTGVIPSDVAGVNRVEAAFSPRVSDIALGLEEDFG